MEKRKIQITCGAGGAQEVGRGVGAEALPTQQAFPGRAGVEREDAATISLLALAKRERRRGSGHPLWEGSHWGSSGQKERNSQPINTQRLTRQRRPRCSRRLAISLPAVISLYLGALVRRWEETGLSNVLKCYYSARGHKALHKYKRQAQG